MNIFLGFIFILIGVINVAAPEIGWNLRYGWRYRDAEPSDAALIWGRVGGVAAIIVGILCFFGLG